MSRKKVISLFESAGFTHYSNGFFWGRNNPNGIYVWAVPYRNGFNLEARKFDGEHYYDSKYIPLEELNLQAINSAVNHLVSTKEVALVTTECYA
jgi:hypothetical protein